MGLFDGGLFDFNGDGETSFGEGFLGFMLFDELMRGDETECNEDDEDGDEEGDEDEFQHN